MDKISLVARRKSRHFAEPTAAMKRAQERERNEAETLTEHLWKTEPAVSENYEPNTTAETPFTPSSKSPDFVLETNIEKAIAQYCAEKLQPNDDRILEAQISQRSNKKIGAEKDNTFISVTFLDHEQTTLLTAREVAEMMKVKTATVIRLARIGAVPAYKIGRSWRFRWEEILDSFKHLPSNGEISDVS